MHPDVSALPFADVVVIGPLDAEVDPGRVVARDVGLGQPGAGHAGEGTGNKYFLIGRGSPAIPIVGRVASGPNSAIRAADVLADLVVVNLSTDSQVKRAAFGSVLDARKKQSEDCTHKIDCMDSARSWAFAHGAFFRTSNDCQSPNCMRNGGGRGERCHSESIPFLFFPCVSPSTGDIDSLFCDPL